jgi:hypothetical protein
MIAPIAFAQLQVPPTSLSDSSCLNAARASSFVVYDPGSAFLPPAAACDAGGGFAASSFLRFSSSASRATASSFAFCSARACAFALASAMALADSASWRRFSASSLFFSSACIAAASLMRLSSSGITHTDFFVCVL